ncbi:diguanylate cyclase [Deinococcus aerophilus]|uniref:diguanylate cyclase n=1 Tax=Deinococcus aerophilus TaxID=522488 RepID=UPI001668981D|nr:diguanylate cyclase [Deinococcus aerophilus]
MASRHAFEAEQDLVAREHLHAALSALNQPEMASSDRPHLPVLQELHQLARLEAQRGNFQGMLDCARTSAQVAQVWNCADMEAEARRLWATAANFTGHLEESVELLRQAARLFSTAGDLVGQIRCLINLGSALTNLGEHADALSALFQAHQLVTQYTNDDPSLNGPCLVNIGHTYHALRQYEAAREYLTLGLEAARAAENLGTQLAALGTLGLVYKSMRQPEDATAMLDMALELASQHGFSRDIIDLSDNLGQVWMERGVPQRALEMHQQSLEVAQEIEDAQGTASALLGLGRAAAALNRLADAAHHLQHALAVTQQHRLRNEEVLVHAELAGVHEQLGQLASALKHHKEFHRLERLLFNEENESRTQTLTARHAAERARMESESYRQIGELAQRAREEAEQTVQVRTRELEQAQLEMVTRLGFAGEYRDDLTGAHTLRVGELSCQLAHVMNLDATEAELLKWAARLHDIGKIGISDAVLLKPGRYTPEEFERMKLHTVIGAKMLQGSQSPLLLMAEQIALTHHERWDGQGYPRGLSGTEIPQVGRIVAVADVYDALTNERPYKPAWSPAEALEEVRRLSGTQFDPQVVGALEQLLAKGDSPDDGRETSRGASPAAGPEPRDPAGQLQPSVMDRLDEPMVPAAQVEQLEALLSASWDLRNSDPQEGERLANKAYALAQELRHLWGLGYAYRNMGFFHFVASRYEEALSMLSRGLEFAAHLEDDVLQLDCANFSAAVYNSLTRHEKAVDMLSVAMRVSRKMGDLKRTANTLHNLGVVTMGYGDHQRAVEYLDAALSTYQNLEDTVGEAQTNGTLAELALERGEFDEAVELATRALTLLRTAPNVFLEATASLYLGKAHRQRGDLAASTEALTLTLTAARSLAHRALEGWALFELGLTHLHARQYQDAQAALRDALEISHAVAQLKLTLEVYQACAQVAEASEEPYEALTYYRLHRAAEQEMLAHDAALKARALTIELEVERAKADTEIFKVRSIELTAANEALERLNAEKTHLLSILETQSKLLERQVSEDDLTGLYNRRYVEQVLAREFKRHKEDGIPLTVAMVDLDHFKQVNDRFSHMVGDQVLRQMGTLFREVVRPSDIVARFGGEEFLIVLPGTDLQQGIRICERLSHHVTSFAWDELQTNLEVTLSIGVAADLSVPNHEKLVSLADARLYQAKAAGRNQVCGEFASGPVHP